MEVDGSVRGRRWRNFHLLPWKLPSISTNFLEKVGGSFHGSSIASMDTDGSFRESIITSMEVDGSSHGTRYKFL